MGTPEAGEIQIGRICSQFFHPTKLLGIFTKTRGARTKIKVTPKVPKMCQDNRYDACNQVRQVR